MLASTSVRRVAEALDLPRSTDQKIMRNILRYYPYKLQFVQELLPHDFETRHLFSLQFLARLEVDPEWPWNTLWTDEAHFHLDGAGGPVTCSVTGQRYVSLLRNKIIPDLQARQCLSLIIFMQDGAPPHITRCVKDILKQHFTEERVISRQFRHLWPPRSPDINPCDFLALGPFKNSWRAIPPSVSSVSAVDILLLYESVYLYVILYPFRSRPRNKAFGRALPSDISTLIARESDDEAKDYVHVKKCFEEIQALCGKIQTALLST
ncbi:transposable element tc3 transposase [Trichonephila clavipes]|nr:transposable element tc3 transposase [Trichonephila clavipes]